VIQTPIPHVPKDIATGDLTGDLLDDLVYVRAPYAGAKVYRNLGNGHFEYLTTLPDVSVTVDVGDLNKDGLDDVVSASYSEVKVLIFHNSRPPGVFRPPVEIPTPAVALTVRVGDLDGDELNDLVVCGVGSLSYIAIYWGTDEGVGSEPDVYECEMEPAYPCGGFTFPGETIIADMTGDGLKDVILIASLDEEGCWVIGTAVGLLRNLGNRQFTPSVEWVVWENGYDEFADLSVGDLNGDELLDFGVVHEEQLGLQTFINIGGGVFAEGEGLNTIAGRHLVFEDLNGDERTDLAWSRAAPLAEIAAGDGSGVLEPVQSLNKSMNDIQAGDLNGNAGLDLVGFYQQVINVFPNITYLDPSGVGEPGDAETRLVVTEPWPNPAADRVFLRLPAGEGRGVEVYDVAGSLLRRLSPDSEGLVSWDRRLGDGRDAASGVYYLRVTSASEAVTRSVLLLK
jgi:hypothetical protein